jgi:hypothetical protein
MGGIREPEVFPAIRILLIKKVLADMIVTSACKWNFIASSAIS